MLKIQDIFIIENGSLEDREIVFHVKVSKPLLLNSVTLFRVIRVFVAVTGAVSILSASSNAILVKGITTFRSERKIMNVHLL